MRSGFSIVKNGSRLGFPFVQSLLSLAPIVDEIIVAHGDSDDDTRERLQELKNQIAVPLQIIESPWDASNTAGGTELARQTNIALDHCKYDVCVYIQADEVFLDKETESNKKNLKKFEQDASVGALLFNWVHIYGAPHLQVRSKSWYRREIRAIKKSWGIRSFRDAQSFRQERRMPNRESEWKKIAAALSPTRVIHYGWLRPAPLMAEKSRILDRLWHGAKRDSYHNEQNVFSKQVGLEAIDFEHPTAMQQWIASMGHARIEDITEKSLLKRTKHETLKWLEQQFDWRPGEFKNYTSLKRY